MKQRVIRVAALGLALSAPAWCDLFGGDIPLLTGILTQAVQALQQAKTLYNLEQQTQQQITSAAMFVSHPQSWQSYLTTAQNALRLVSNGSDAAALQRINQTLQATQQAYTQLSSQGMTTANMAAMSQLALQQVDLKQKADELNAHLQFELQVDQYAQTGVGQISVGSSLTRVMR